MKEETEQIGDESQLAVGSVEQNTSEDGDDTQQGAPSPAEEKEHIDEEEGFVNETKNEGENKENDGRILSSDVSRKDESRSEDSSFADDSTINEDVYDRMEENEESSAELVTVPSYENETENKNPKRIVYDLAGEKVASEEEKVEIETSESPVLRKELIESGLVVSVTNQNVKESEIIRNDSNNKSESDKEKERQKKRQRAKLGFILIFIIIIAFASAAAIVFTWKEKPRCEPSYNGRSSKRLGDGFCHPDLNNAVCNWDNGDCEATKHLYENCNYTDDDMGYYWYHRVSIGDGHCDQQHYQYIYYPSNISECRFEGGDCIRLNCTESQELEDRQEFCEEYRAKYPNCNVDNALKIGNGICNFVGEYNTEICGFDGGDCAEYPECRFDESEVQADSSWNNLWSYHHDLISFFKDGHCNSILNKKECAFDGGDCIDFNKKFPDCHVGSEKLLGDGTCHNFGGYNTEECKWDNGDCVEFNSKYPNCNVEAAYSIGDGWCDVQYNTEVCGFDGGDCIEFNTKYPNCNVSQPYRVGNGVCDKKYPYNSIDCLWDGGDCPGYPNCTIATEGFLFKKIGDGQCDGGIFNTESCGWDGGDCLQFNENYPNCTAEYPWNIGDGQCDFGEYNSTACKWDGGDCVVEGYPNCNVALKYKLGNGQCDMGYESYNTEECGWDLGDCDEFNAKYPNCKVSEPYRVGNGVCDKKYPYNSIDCLWDGGDCPGYPNCTIAAEGFLFKKIGDGQCDGEYSTRNHAVGTGEIAFNSMKTIRTALLSILGILETDNVILESTTVPPASGMGEIV